MAGSDAAGAAAATEEGKILFASGVDGLQTMDPDGSGRASFSPPIPNASYPEWSADGTKFVYVEQDTNRIVVSSADGAERTPVPYNAASFVRYPTLSPDGTRVAFAVDDSAYVCSEIGECTNANTSDVYTVDVDGSDLTRLDSDVPSRCCSPTSIGPLQVTR